MVDCSCHLILSYPGQLTNENQQSRVNLYAVYLCVHCARSLKARSPVWQARLTRNWNYSMPLVLLVDKLLRIEFVINPSLSSCLLLLLSIFIWFVELIDALFQENFLYFIKLSPSFSCRLLLAKLLVIFLDLETKSN